MSDSCTCHTPWVKGEGSLSLGASQRVLRGPEENLEDAAHEAEAIKEIVMGHIKWEVCFVSS